MQKRNQKTERKKRKKLYLKHGHLIGCATEDIPEQHRAAKGGLRCFRNTYPRDPDGNKIKTAPKHRCGNVCSKGSLYCRHHGGANSRALVNGQSTALDKYKGAFDGKLSSILETFMSDPDILSYNRELATLRLLLVQYIDKFSRNKPIRNSKKLVRLIQGVLKADHLAGSAEKFFTIKEIVDNESELTDGNVIDRLSRIIENIGKAIERIERMERKSDFYMTPEGLRILLRGIIEVINTCVADDEIKKKIRQSLLNIQTKTSGSVKEIPIKAE